MTLYLRLKLTKWDTLGLSVGDHGTIGVGVGYGKSIGMCLVYESVEAFLEDFPGEAPVIVYTVDNGNEQL